MQQTSYSKKALKHFKNPHNYGRLKDYDGHGQVGNIICGDLMSLYIKIKKYKKNPPAIGKEIIKNISFETFGCVAAISTSSAITDLAKGKTINRALKISKDDVARALGGLPPIKMHCSLLAIDALSEAIYDYLLKNKKSVPENLEQKHKRIETSKKIIEERYKKN